MSSSAGIAKVRVRPGDNGESGKLAGHRQNGADSGRIVLDCTGVFFRGFSDG